MTMHNTPGVILIPCGETIPSQAVLAFMGMRSPAGTSLHMDPGGTTLAQKRNALVAAALERPNAKWIFFLDSDMVPPPDTLLQLLPYLARHPIIGAAYCARRPPYMMECGTAGGQIMSFSDATPRNAVVPVAWTGFGCVLIRRDVFEAAPGPWFSGNAEGVDEDGRFCIAAAALGFPTHVHRGVTVGHLGGVAITPDLAAAFQSGYSKGHKRTAPKEQGGHTLWHLTRRGGE